WDGDASFISLIKQFEAPSAKTYFFVTTTLATYTKYTSLMKDVISEIEAPAYGPWPSNALSYLAATGTTATAITTTPHQVSVGDWFQLSGNLPAGYNGWFEAALGTSGETLVWQLPSAQGAETALGTLLSQPYQSDGIGSTEFSLATAFWVWLNYNPKSSNKVTPFAFSFLFGATAFPTQGNGSLLTTLKAAFTNVVGTGAEGGISDLIQLWGTTQDGNDATYWYSVDWVQINLDLNLANAVINGLAFGTLTKTELSASDFNDALNAGTFAGQVVVNAEPFIAYNSENPNDYSEGIYDGISVVYTPSRGFTQIVVNLVVQNFVAV